MQSVELSQPVDLNLLTRAANFVNESLGIENHMDVVSGDISRPQGAVNAFIEIHNHLQGEKIINEATLRTLGKSILRKNCVIDKCDFERLESLNG